MNLFLPVYFSGLYLYDSSACFTHDLRCGTRKFTCGGFCVPRDEFVTQGKNERQPLQRRADRKRKTIEEKENVTQRSRDVRRVPSSFHTTTHTHKRALSRLNS